MLTKVPLHPHPSDSGWPGGRVPVPREKDKQIRVCVSSISQCAPKEVHLDTRDYTVCVSMFARPLQTSSLAGPRNTSSLTATCFDDAVEEGEGEDPPLSDLWLYEIAFGPHQTPKIGPNIPPQDTPDAPKQTPKIEPQKETQNGTPYLPLPQHAL